MKEETARERLDERSERERILTLDVAIVEGGIVPLYWDHKVPDFQKIIFRDLYAAAAADVCPVILDGQ